MLIVDANATGRRLYPSVPIFVKVTRLSDFNIDKFYADPVDPSIAALNPEGYWFREDEITAVPAPRRTKGKYIGERVMQF